MRSAFQRPQRSLARLWRLARARIWRQPTFSEPASDEYGSLSYLDSFGAYLSHRGDKHPKSHLMGISGDAFKFFYDRTNPTRSGWVFLHNPLRAAAAALGYRHEIAFYETAQAGLDALDAHHQTGDPAILQSGEEFPLAFPGYRLWLPNGERTVTRAELAEAWTPTEGFLELGLYGWYLFLLHEKERKPRPQDVYLGALRRALKIARTERRVRGCFIGLQAYDAMINALRAKRDPARVTRNELLRIAGWNTLSAWLLLEGRRAAVRFLLDAVVYFDDPDQKRALTKAADLYEQVVEALRRVRELHPSTDPSSGARLVISPDQEQFTPREIRAFFAACRRASRALEKAQNAEYKAVQEIRRVINISERSAL